VEDQEFHALAHDVKARVEELHASVLAENSAMSSKPPPAMDAAPPAAAMKVDDYADRVYRANRNLGL
jgi:hypothetical protein